MSYKIYYSGDEYNDMEFKTLKEAKEYMLHEAESLVEQEMDYYIENELACFEAVKIKNKVAKI